MIHTIKSTAIVLLICALAAINTSCTTHESANPLTGTWTGVCEGDQISITLNPDGSCYGIEAGTATNGTWTQQGTSVTMTFEGEDLHGGLLTEEEMLLTESEPRRVARLHKEK